MQGAPNLADPEKRTLHLVVPWWRPMVQAQLGSTSSVERVIEQKKVIERKK